MPPTVAEASRLPALFIKKSKTTNKKISILPSASTYLFRFKKWVTLCPRYHPAQAADEPAAKSTRYNGEKYECGLHEFSNQADFPI
jgi:hypothetical protein